MILEGGKGEYLARCPHAAGNRRGSGRSWIDALGVHGKRGTGEDPVGDLSRAAIDETDRLVVHGGAIPMTDVREFDAAHHLDNSAVIAANLEEAFATGDNHLARLNTGDEFDALIRRGRRCH